MMNNRLRLLSGNEPLMLDPTDGWETLGQATDVFRNIDRNFERWNCNVEGPPTRENPVRVCEMARDSIFQEIVWWFWRSARFSRPHASADQAIREILW